MPKAKKDKFGVVIILFLIWIGLSFFSTLLSVFSSHNSFIGPIFFESTGSLIFYLVILIMYGLIFFGTINRKMWARTLTFVFYSITLIIGLIDLISIFVIRDKILDFVLQSVKMPETQNAIAMEMARTFVVVGAVFGFIFQLIVSVLIFVLLVKKKEFFNK